MWKIKATQLWNVNILSFTPICYLCSLDENKGHLSEINQYARNVISIHYTKSEKKMRGWFELLEKKNDEAFRTKIRVYRVDTIVEVYRKECFTFRMKKFM